MRDTTYVDSKAFLVQLIFRIPYLLLIAVTGAILGSGLYLLIMTINFRTPIYENETKYYVYFNENKFDAPHYYNDYTWEHDILRSDLVLGKMMEILGADYNRDDVGNMMSSRILADVRFLTVTIKGKDKEKIKNISEALNKALCMLVEDESVNDLSKIMQIEDSGANEVKVHYFTWRAAVLGAVLFFIIAIFVESVRFGMGTRFYTKNDITSRLNIPALAVFYKNENNDLEKRHMEIHLEHMGYSAEEVSFIAYDTDLVSMGYNELRNKKGVVLEIPAEIETLPRTNELIQNLKIQDVKVVGAVLTNVNKTWYNIYMSGSKKSKEK